MSSPTWGPAERTAGDTLIRLALEEDLGQIGDLTCQAIIPETLPGRAVFVARQEGVVAGLPLVEQVFAALAPGAEVDVRVADGTFVAPRTKLAVIRGSLRTILSGERTALNFLQRLSGVATQTRRYVDQLANTRCSLLDTRKTTPGWRILEKYAVRCGGGRNHRMGLFDAVMIKDNHLAGLRHEGTPLRAAVLKARERFAHDVTIEVEVDSLEQLREALDVRPDIVLLDNMRPPQLREAVTLRNERAPQVRLEASGGITLHNLRETAETGVDYVSVGALTHSAVALDIALDYED